MSNLVCGNNVKWADVSYAARVGHSAIRSAWKRKIPPDWSVDGSWSGNGAGGWGGFLLLFWAHPLFQSVQHLDLKSCNSCVSTRRPYVTATCRPFLRHHGICVNGQSGAATCVRGVRSPWCGCTGRLCVRRVALQTSRSFPSLLITSNYSYKII